MQSRVQLQRSYPGWVAPPAVLIDVADLAALHGAKGLPPPSSTGVAVATRVRVTVSASWRATKTTRGNVREVSGTAAEVAAAITKDSPSRVQIGAYAHERGIVFVEWLSWSGCRLTVRGEPAWAEETLAALDHALSPHARWWGRLNWLHRLLIPVTLIALAAVVAGLLPEGSFLAYAPILLAVAVAAPPILGRDSWPLPFEFAEPGEVTAARQAWLLVAWYGLGLIALLAGLAVLLRS